ncbi:hypothetical protein P278_32580 [Zhouia amylolytica AD3]|uniref:Uncharacterized protein n=2 Tax=Zhouia amylolytica TaxID=376730 RepID=W2UIL3_9FLAO|nr:hypothetical protein P278_32580 [Zhouia amylolytica AD3]
MNIPIHKALLRCLVKYLLGWISLLSISLSPQNLAIHDHLSGSVVLVDE